MDKAKREKIKAEVQAARDAVFSVYEPETDAKKKRKLGEALGACDRALNLLDEPETGSGYPRMMTVSGGPGLR